MAELKSKIFRSDRKQPILLSFVSYFFRSGHFADFDALGYCIISSLIIWIVIKLSFIMMEKVH